MKLYQHVLFVGLGGTGLEIGAELERRLREEICGPDGTLFQRKREDAQPYQLPSCLQFVYADMHQGDLDKMPLKVVPSAQHVQAVHHTAHYVRDLVPQVNIYPQVAQNLRHAAGPIVEPWLPPPGQEPRVLVKRGAGQMPTVGRAALFETFRSGLAPAIRDLKAALGNLSQAAPDLRKLAGPGSRTHSRAVDVFVAFSVAGGTGAGIFYDYLHLIGEQFKSVDLDAQIYPLVLMPSAFEEGKGGGRAAELNAGRALLDLFRLIDHQNSKDAERKLPGLDGGPPDSEDIAVRYPDKGQIFRATMPASIAQTAFLFSRPVGAQPDDLRRSVVSLIMSLIGTEIDEVHGGVDGEQHQSFADSFVNSTGDRQSPAENGIGNRGVSTAQVTSLTTPVEELADIVAGRLLRAGIEELREPVPSTEKNEALIEEFFNLSHIHEIFARRVPDFQEVEAATGAREITAALEDRLALMRRELKDHQARLDKDVPAMVTKFNPGEAVSELLTRYDPFRIRRVTSGHAAFTDRKNKEGAAGLMQLLRTSPPPPEGFRDAPPQLPQLRDRVVGMVKVKWTDDDPVTAREDQETWYRWRSRAAWAQPWSAQSTRWLRALERVEHQLRDLNQALDDLASEDPDRFRNRSESLYRPRVGVAFHLPPGSLERFYQVVINRIRDQRRLPPTASDAELLRQLLDQDGWQEVYRQSMETTAEKAVNELRKRIKTRVKTYLQEEIEGKATLLPKLRDLLNQAAGQETNRLAFSDEEIDEFTSRLAGLVPANFTPQGTGPLEVRVFYPGVYNSTINEFLRESLELRSGANIVYKFSGTTAESISVVLFRSGMGITDVQEVRYVLRSWAGALGDPREEDFLPWRQRNGYHFGYLATRHEHRVRILHRLLCAMWNGDIHPDGDPFSPRRALVELDGVTMALNLKALEDASSWGSILQAYELWTLADTDGSEQAFCARLMRATPHDLDQGGIEPSKLFEQFIEMKKDQPDRLTRILGEIPPGSRTRAELLLEFWTTTLPDALAYPFVGQATRNNLGELYEAIKRRGTGGPA
jgi:hypothetical protein